MTLATLLIAVSHPFSSALSTNLITNPSVETASPINLAQPLSWSQGRWGTNITTFSYANTGHSGSHSLSVQMSSYTNGDAKWFFSPLNVTAGASYTYSEYYISSASTDVLAVFTNSLGGASYKYLGSPAQSSSWNQFTSKFVVPDGTVSMTVYHLIYSVGTLQTDDYSLVQNSTTQVSITNPSNSQILSGTSTLTATATDSADIQSVRFQLDGSDISPAITASPYSFNWDSKTASNGNHSLTAIATNNLGQETTSDPVGININNTVLGSNDSLLPNSDLETVDPVNPSRPLNWRSGKWGTMTYANDYLNSGRNSAHSVKTEITSYTSGAAYWYNLNQAVTPGKNYKFADYYKSSIPSEIDIAVNMNDGSTKYIYLGTAAASQSNWTKFEKVFTAPQGAVSINIYHEIYAVGWLITDDYSLTESNQTQVSVTSPSNGQSVSGNVNIAANAQDNSGVTKVQFKIDGQNLGAPVTTAPYSYSFDSTLVSNGIHAISAAATNSLGLTTNSASVSVTVNNQPALSDLISNRSLEIADINNTSRPAGWTAGSWGSNSATLTYPNSGHSGTKSVRTEITSYTSGAAHWISNTFAVTPGQLYDFTDYYMSNTTTQIIAAFKLSDGTTKYSWLGSPVESPGGWTKYRRQFVAPANAVSLNVYHELYSVGWVVSDDYSVKPFSYQGFNRALISITDDDGYVSFYNYGLPLLNKYGFKSTDYIISDDPNRGSAYMSDRMIKNLYNSGQEIGSHSVNHPDLSTLNDTDLTYQLASSQTYLQTLLGVPITNFAAPYGSYNQHVLDFAGNYYGSFRTVDAGYNAKNNFDPYRIQVQNLHSDTKLSDVVAWINQAKATNTWLVLVYHQIDPSTSAGTYNTYPSDFDAQLSAIKSSGVTVKTVGQALQELVPQL